MTHLWGTPAKSLKEQFNLVTFVETGCENGEGLQLAKAYGFSEEQLYSCDIRSEAVSEVSKLLPKATILLGDSVEFIKQLASVIDTPTLFWLDAHFPTLYNHQSGTRWPLFQELEYIKTKKGMEKDVIICDDMRVLNSPKNPRFNIGELGEITQWLVEVDWDAFVHTFAETHDAQSVLVDTGLMVFLPKK